MSKRKPIIGITVDCKQDPEDLRTRGKLVLNWNYAQAIADSGGVPILIPPTADMDIIATLVDGWLIPGGNDIDAKYFGEENHPTVEPIDPARFEGEQRLYKSIPANLPVFGICYGCQFINVMEGGSLIQHVPDIVGHESHSGGTLQTYQIESESHLASASATIQMEGKSYHHQAINRVGNGFKVVAKSDDGIVEAIENSDRPWLIGVQWHPERSLSDPATENLFRSFIESAKVYASSRN